MKQEQLKWSDVQWANYLSCTVAEYKQAHEFINKLYSICVYKNKKTGKYMIELSKRHDTPSGATRYMPQLSTYAIFDSVEHAELFANEKFIPSLELNNFWSKNYGVPSKILQTLHVRTR